MVRTMKPQLENHSKTIRPCGLFINVKFPFLGASPDGIIKHKGILEIKCPWSVRNITPEESVTRKFISFWNNSAGEVNQNHNWFYQIQGQLHIAKKSYCVFTVWAPHGVKIKPTTSFGKEIWKPN